MRSRSTARARGIDDPDAVIQVDDQRGGSARVANHASIASTIGAK
jgi:hypothetical protein